MAAQSVAEADGALRAPRVRDRSIDVLKGLGIVIVMMGHIDFSPIGGTFISYLYMFNVPLFFIIAGYMWRPKQGQSFLAIVVTKFRQIGIPYVVLFIVSLLYGHLIAGGPFNDPIGPFAWKPTLKALLFSSEWLNGVPAFNFALWFLPIFFIASVAFHLLQKIGNLWVYAAVLVALFIASLPFQYLVPGRPILSINVLPVALVFMGCGYLIKRFLPIARLNLLVLTLLFAGTLAIAMYYPGNIAGMNTYWYIPSALASFVLYLRLARDIESSRLLGYIGRNSLLMFGLHSLVANTYRMTGIPDFVAGTWSGLMLYAVNLAYVVLGTLAVVMAYRWVRGRVDQARARRSERRRAVPETASAEEAPRTAGSAGDATGDAAAGDLVPTTR